MTTSIDWVHEIDASLDGIDQPPAAYVPLPRIPRWHRHPLPSVQAFSDYVAERGPHVRRLAHAICCDWAQAEALVMVTFTRLYDSWHRIAGSDAADAFVHRSLARAGVCLLYTSPSPRDRS